MASNVCASWWPAMDSELPAPVSHSGVMDEDRPTRVAVALLPSGERERPRTTWLLLARACTRCAGSPAASGAIDYTFSDDGRELASDAAGHKRELAPIMRAIAFGSSDPPRRSTLTTKSRTAQTVRPAPQSTKGVMAMRPV